MLDISIIEKRSFNFNGIIYIYRSLLDYINNYKGDISDQEAQIIIKDICSGLYTMYSKNLQ